MQRVSDGGIGYRVRTVWRGWEIFFEKTLKGVGGESILRGAGEESASEVEH
jgi:hypothetical protein